jgi:outer membrane lipoprotein-sorting protein
MGAAPGPSQGSLKHGPYNLTRHYLTEKDLLPMRRLRTTSTQRLMTIVAAVVALALTGALAQAAIGGNDPKPEPKPLDRAVHDAVTAPPVEGVSARIAFTNGLLPSGSMPDGGGSPLAAGAEGRLWLADDGRARLELQSEVGDAQIVADGERVTVYDSSSETAYTMPLPADDRERAHEDPSLTDVRRGLDRLAEAWTLSRAQPTSTAGRPTYTVRIAPKDDGGLLGAAELAWDALNGVPLRAAVYAQGQDEPVLELEAEDVSYGAIDGSTFDARPPAGTRVVEIDPPVGVDEQGRPTRVRGVDAVQDRLPFELSAPAELAGLPRMEVRLVDAGGTPGAMSVYGKGMGAIVVLQHEAGPQDGRTGDFELPQVNIDGATGTEIATPLGTLVRFQRGGVAYTVLGSVPPVAAENAARGL